jgi:PAS domain S-box-containing protein
MNIGKLLSGLGDVSVPMTPTVTEPQASELLRQRSERLAASYEQAGIGIVETDTEGRLLRVNAQICALMGFAPEELLGRSIFAEAHPDDAVSDRTQYLRQVAGELDRYSIEKRIRRKDGTYFWSAITSSAVSDEAGRFLYAVRVQHDISDRKRAEESLAKRMQEQAALYEFTKRVQFAGSVKALYEPALDAIIRALRCQRASILLFDEAGVMRFVAARGLSDGYRRAVEGHSPWAPDAKEPKPICIEDVERADLEDSLKRTVKAEGIGALTFIPLWPSGRLIGKFMAYYDTPHIFSDAELDLAVTIAHQLGFGIQRIRGEAAACQLVSIVESSNDAIVSKDLNGIITSWNRGAERIFGYTAEEVIGKPVTILMPPERVDEESGILARLRRGERIEHYETVRQRKDGTHVDISLTLSPMVDSFGCVVGASKIARDITERKYAEASLRESERRLQELLNAIPGAIYTTDAEGKITYYNQAAVEFAGRTPTIGSDEWCVSWKLYWPDGTPLPHHECPMAVSLREGRPIRGKEAVAERPDGTRIPFIPYPTLLRDSDGKMVGAINMLVDISQRKEAETQQQILLKELNHRVKNNMQMVQSLLYSAAKKTTSKDAQQVLHETAGRIATMAAAQSVLYSTIDATQFDAKEFIKAVCQTVEQLFPVKVSVDCGESIALSNDVAMPLALILNELLTNAVKHGLNGEGDAIVRVGLVKETDAFRLFVEDSGTGFDLDTVHGRSSGIRIVQGLARQLGGRLEVTKYPSRCAVYFG